MIKEICFDMDGTIANFYGVENWLDYLTHSSTYPYAAAKPMLRMSALARKLNQLQRNGYKLKIISWTSKCGTDEFNAEIATTKLSWLDVHLHSVKFDEIHIIPYGTPKSSFGSGILFDDECGNREEWGANAFPPELIMQILNSL